MSVIVVIASVVINVAVIVLNPVTIKIFPRAEFPDARGVLIA